MVNLDWSKKQLNGASILIVEDNPINQMIVADILESIGTKITSAENGQQALNRLANENFDLIIMDTQMPIMDGYETTNHIRNILKLQNIPIVALTAYATPEHRQSCLRAGMNDFMSKPVNPKLLYQILAKWISRNNFCINTCNNPVNEENAVSPIDIDVLKNVFDHDSQLIRIFSLKFLEVAEETLNEIHQARICNDIKSMGHQGHKLKSSALSMGAFHLSELCNRLEIAGNNNDQQLAGQICDQIFEHHRQVRIKLKEMLTKEF